MAPAAALATVGVTCTARCFGSTTPRDAGALGRAQQGAEVARVGHAVDGDEERRRAALGRFGPGRRARPRAAGWPWPGRPGAPRCGPGRRACAGSPRATGTRWSAARSTMSAITPASSRSVATQSSRTLRRPASSSSRTAWRPSTCSPPRPRSRSLAPTGTPARRPWPRPPSPPRPPAALPDRAPAGAALGRGRPPVRAAGRARPPPPLPLARRCRPLTSWPPGPPPSRRCPRPGRWRPGSRPGVPSRSPARRPRRPGAPPSRPAAAPASGARTPRCSRRSPPSSPPPRSMRATSRSMSIESAPCQRSSVSGKCWPMSPRPAAPSRASATAWATTSASLWPARPRSPGNSHPAEHHATGGVVGEAVDVEALADPHGDHRRSPTTRWRAHDEIVGHRELAVGRIAGHGHHPPAGRLDQGGVVGALAAAGVGPAQAGGPEPLRRLHGDQVGARSAWPPPRRRRRPASPCRPPGRRARPRRLRRAPRPRRRRTARRRRTVGRRRAPR